MIFSSSPQFILLFSQILLSTLPTFASPHPANSDSSVNDNLVTSHPISPSSSDDFSSSDDDDSDTSSSPSAHNTLRSGEPICRNDVLCWSANFSLGKFIISRADAEHGVLQINARGINNPASISFAQNGEQQAGDTTLPLRFPYFGATVAIFMIDAVSQEAHLVEEAISGGQLGARRDTATWMSLFLAAHKLLYACVVGQRGQGGWVAVGDGKKMGIGIYLTGSRADGWVDGRSFVPPPSGAGRV